MSSKYFFFLGSVPDPPELLADPAVSGSVATVSGIHGVLDLGFPSVESGTATTLEAPDLDNVLPSVHATSGTVAVMGTKPSRVVAPSRRDFTVLWFGR